MTLKEANRELKSLNNEYNYWLREKEQLMSIVLPKSTDLTKGDRVDGGKRIDRMAKYTELLENKQIDATLEYIQKRRNNLMNYIDEELKLLGEYEPLERKIILMRNEKRMKWREIAMISGYCERQCQRIYDKYYKRETKRRTKL